jgi:hypothetical protein
MNIKWVILPAVMIFAAGCALLPVRDDSIFSPAEKKLLEKTTEALDFGFGYDEEVGLDYIHSHSFSEANIPAREKALAATLKDVDPGDLLRFYGKVYRLGVMMRHRMAGYEKERNWRQYTYIKNYLIPPLDSFTGHIRKQLLAGNVATESRLAALHASIEKAVADYFYELEMEVLRDQWRI